MSTTTLTTEKVRAIAAGDIYADANGEDWESIWGRVFKE